MQQASIDGSMMQVHIQVMETFFSGEHLVDWLLVLTGNWVLSEVQGSLGHILI